MEAKSQSLWWTSSFEDEDCPTLKIGNRSQTWDLRFLKVFDVLGYRFHRDGKRYSGDRKRCAKGWAVVGVMVTSTVQRAYP